MTEERLPNTEIRSYDSDGIINGLREKIKLTLDKNKTETRIVKNLRTALQIEKALKIHRDFEKKNNFLAMPYFNVFKVGFIRDRKPAFFLFNPTNLMWDSHFIDRPSKIISGSSAEETLNKLLASRHQDRQTGLNLSTQ
jgi:hypothetical protein